MSDSPETNDETTAAPEAVPELPEPAAIPDSPWKADLEAQFSDPATRASVDAYMREKVQPRITQLEQATTGNRDADRLWNDFREDPQGTFEAVAAEIYGKDDAAKIAELVAAEDEDREADLTDAEVTEAKTQLEDPRVKEAVEYVEDQRAEKAYYNALDQLKTAHENDEGAVKIEDKFFHPFVVSEDGDFEAAYTGYQEWAKEAQATFNTGVPSTDDVAPAVVGESGTTTPPQAKKYDDFDAALDDWFTEQKNPPTTVGNV